VKNGKVDLILLLNQVMMFFGSLAYVKVSMD